MPSADIDSVKGILMGGPPNRKFKKRPIIIEAIRWNGKLDALADWMNERGDKGLPIYLTQIPKLVIRTLEGDMTCDIGDWIIRGVKDEFYPCKPDIFEMTYEPA